MAKTGRPTKPPDELREITIPVRVTADEHRRAVEIANKENRSISGWLYLVFKNAIIETRKRK